MLAAENDALPGGKVGGIGDVIRDIPPALAASGAKVSVLLPSYGVFHRLPKATFLQAVHVPFMGRTESVAIYQLNDERHSGVQQIVLEHDLFSACGVGRIYCNDGADQPFATDANKFALFSAAALSAICDNAFDHVDIIHLHDWHAAMAVVLAFYDPQYKTIKNTSLIFSIHNLAMQGVRPLAGHTSSWESWFPHLDVPLASIVDPRWPDCVNPMAAAIRLSSKVHTVSPTYATEIQQSNDATRGFHGGEGLEADLMAAHKERRLVGILNGTDYAPESQQDRAAIPAKQENYWQSLLHMISEHALQWLGESEPMRAVHYLAHQRTLSWLTRTTPKHVVTSVGRLTDQKMAIPLHIMPDGRAALEHMLERLALDDGVFILLGTGDAELEQHCQKIASAHANCLFLNRYAAAVAEALFQNGDLFFMPSSFEPCGISQLVAMRYGQPCLVHAVGGLSDTIIDNVDGFQFSGNSPAAQAAHCVKRFDDALTLHASNDRAWQAMETAAASRRFTWASSAEQYHEKLYKSNASS